MVMQLAIGVLERPSLHDAPRGLSASKTCHKTGHEMKRKSIALVLKNHHMKNCQGKKSGLSGSSMRLRLRHMLRMFQFSMFNGRWSEIGFGLKSAVLRRGYPLGEDVAGLWIHREVP